MTVPVFQAVGNQSAGTGAISVAWPAHVVDDFAILVIETGGEGTILTPPAGWATITGPFADVPTAAGSRLYAWYKFAASAAEAAVSVADSGDHQIARIYTFRNVNRQTPFRSSGFITSSHPSVVAGGTITFGASSTDVPEPLAVFICSRTNDSNSTTNFTVLTQDFTNNGAVINRGEGGSNAGHGGGFALFTGNSLLNSNSVTDGVVPSDPSVQHNLQVTSVLSTSSVIFSILLRQKVDLIHQNFHLKNWIENNTNVGAVAGNPGTLPTGWAFDGSGVITQEVLGTGTQDGIPYVDIKFSAAAAITNNLIPCLTFHSTVVPITYPRSNPGQTNWLFSTNLAVIDRQGSSNPKNDVFGLRVITTIGSGPQTSASGADYASAFPEPPGSPVPFNTRRNVSISFPYNFNAEVNFKVRLDFSFGSAGYITLRIGLPSLVQQAGSVETIEPIRTSGTALEAPNANQFFTHVVVKRSAEVGTFTITGQPAEVKKTKYAINAEVGSYSINGDYLGGGGSVGVAIQEPTLINPPYNIIDSCKDSSDNIYILSKSGDAQGSQDFLITKFNSAGTVLWSRRIDVNGIILATGTIYADASNVYTVYNFGSTNRLIRLNASTGATLSSNILSYNSIEVNVQFIVGTNTGDFFIVSINPSNANIVVFKFNSSFVLQWTRLITNVQNSNINLSRECAFVLNDGSLIIAGVTSSIPNIRELLKISSTGSISRLLAIPNVDYSAFDVTTDGTDIYVTASLGYTSTPNASTVYRLDSNLNVLYAINLDSYQLGQDNGFDVSANKLSFYGGKIYFSGVNQVVSGNYRSVLGRLDASSESAIKVDWVSLVDLIGPSFVFSGYSVASKIFSLSNGRLVYVGSSHSSGLGFRIYNTPESFIVHPSYTLGGSTYRSDLAVIDKVPTYTVGGINSNDGSKYSSTTVTGAVGTYTAYGNTSVVPTFSIFTLPNASVGASTQLVLRRSIKFNAEVGTYNLSGISNTFVYTRKIKLDAESDSYSVYHSTNNRRYFNIKLDTPEVSDYASDFKRDSSGNLYILINHLEGVGASIVKYSSTGRFQWATKINDIFRANDLALNSDGSQLYLSAISNELNGTGSVNLGFPRKSVVFRINPVDGSIVWQVLYSGQDGFYNALCFSTTANVLYLVYNGSIWATEGYKVAQINPSNGNVISIIVSNQFVSSKEYNATLDNSGNLYIFVDTSGGSNSTFITKISSAFNVLWAREHRISGNISSPVNGFQFDSSNNLYLIGERTSLTYVTKINGSTGASLWFKVYSINVPLGQTTYTTSGADLAITSGGTVYGLSSSFNPNVFYQINPTTGALSSFNIASTTKYRYDKLLLDSNQDFILLGNDAFTNDELIVSNIPSSFFPDDINLSDVRFDVEITPTEVTTLTLSLNTVTVTLTGGSTVTISDNRTTTALTNSIEVYNQDFITPTALFRGRPFRADGGSYNVVGQPATLAKDRVFGTFFGTYSIAGQPAEFLTNLELNAEFGTYSISGQTVSVNRSVNSQSGSLILTGNDSTLAYGRVFNAESGSFVLSGQDATLTKVNKYIFNAENGHYEIAGKEANLRFTPILIANIGYYEILPQPSSLSYGRVFNIEVGSYAYSGNTADLYHYRVINAEQGSYTHSGQDANLVNDQNLNLESGSYSLTGQDVTLSKNKVLNSEFGVYSYSGQPANLRFDRQLNIGFGEGFYSVSGKNAGLYNNQNLNLESGSYNLTGQDADFIQALSFSVNQGSYNLSGQDSTLITDRVINAESGSLTVNGQSPYLSWHRIFELDLGVYTTVGQDADFIQTLSFGVNQGSYNLSGQDSSLVADKAINAESGSFILTGQSATQLLVKSIPAELGSYDITGQDADLDVRAADRTLIATPEQLTIEGQPITAVRTLVFIAESGSYDYTGQNANVSIGYKLQSDFGTLSIAGQNNAFIYDHVTLADFGALSLSGSEANLSRTYQFTADFGSYSYAGSEALLSRSRQFLVDFGVYSSNGQDSLLSRTVLFNVDPEQYTLTGESALLIESLVLQADFGAYSLTGNDSQLTFNRVFTVEFGSYSISGQNSEFIQDLVFNAESGSTFISGQEAYFYRGYSLNPEFGSFALTGQPANLANNKVLDSQFGEYALNGQSSQFLRDYVFTAEFGEYITSGQPAFDIQAGKLNAQPGVYQLSGQDASLSQTDIFIADSGSYTTIGQDARLAHDRKIVAEHGVFATSGQNASLSKNFAIQAESGQYSVNGFDTDLDNNQILDADFTDYFLTGQDADLSRIRQLNALSGQIIVTGFDVSYYRTYALKSSVGNYDILGQDADLFRGAGAADPGQYGITGQYAFLVHNRILRAQSDNYTKSNWADPNYVDPNYAYGTDAKLRVVRRVYPFSGSYSITGYPAVIDYDSVGELSDIIYKLLANRQELDPINGKFRIYDNDNVTILFESSAWADAEGTIPFSGGVLRRIDKLMPP